MRDVHGAHARRGSAAGASRFLTGLVTCFATQDGIPAVVARRLAPVGAGRHTDQLGEAAAEGAQRRTADREADLGDAEVATAQQRHRALDAARHQVAVRRLAVGEPELAAEVPGGHVHAAGERLDVQRLCVLPVDPVADAAQEREVAQVRGGGGGADAHIRDRATSHGGCPVRSAAGTATPARAPTWTAGPGHRRYRCMPLTELITDPSVDRIHLPNSVGRDEDPEDHDDEDGRPLVRATPGPHTPL